MKYFILLLSFLSQLSYAQTAQFTAPDTVYVNTPVNVVNTSTGGTSYYWSFSASDMSGEPVLTTFSPGTYDYENTFIEIVREDSSYYGFMTRNYGLWRLSFGNSLLNTPTITNLGDVWGIIPPRAQGLQILKDVNGWHIILVGGEDPSVETRVIQLDFGSSLANSSTAGVNWGNIADMRSPVGIYVWKDADSSRYYGYITQHEKRSMVLADFGTTPGNTPSASDVGELDDAFWPGGLTAAKRNGQYYLFVANEDDGGYVGNWVNRINFGSNLLSPYTTSYNDLYLPDSVHGPKDVTIYNDNGIDRGYVVNLDPSFLTKFSFPGNDMASNTIHIDSVYTMGEFNGPYSITNFLSSGNDLVAFVNNMWANTLTRIVYPGVSGSSVNGSSQKDPAAFSYTTPGTYKIRLSMDEGLMTQQSIYKTIVVLPQPPVHPGGPGSQFKLYPNPTAGTLYLEMNSKYNSLQVFTITTVSGRVVYAKQFRVVAGKNKLEITLPPSVKDGVYVISNGSCVKKFVLKRP